MTTSRGCLICGTQLGLFASPGDVLCHRAQCAWLYRATPPQQRCLTCARPLTTSELAGGVCANHGCRIQLHEARRSAARKELELAGERLARRLAAELKVVDGHPARVFIPSFDDRVTRPGVKRVRELRRHLESIVSASHDVPVPETPAATNEPAAPALSQAFGAACATCRGNCCRHGGSHAYLKPETIAGYRATNPGVGDADIVQHYLDQVPQASCRQSCLYHSGHGCTLPRAMRSATCNDFFCGALKDFEASHGTRPLPVVFLATDHNRVRRATLVTADRLRTARGTRGSARKPTPPPVRSSPA